MGNVKHYFDEGEEGGLGFWERGFLIEYAERTAEAEFKGLLKLRKVFRKPELR